MFYFGKQRFIAWKKGRRTHSNGLLLSMYLLIMWIFFFKISIGFSLDCLLEKFIFNVTAAFLKLTCTRISCIVCCLNCSE